MLGSWLLGFVGWWVNLAGIVLFALAIFGWSQGGDNTSAANAMCFMAVAAVVGGSYMRYVSRHSVRVRDSKLR
jgi:hypothetical protein